MPNLQKNKVRQPQTPITQETENYKIEIKEVEEKEIPVDKLPFKEKWKETPSATTKTIDELFEKYRKYGLVDENVKESLRNYLRQYQADADKKNAIKSLMQNQTLRNAIRQEQIQPFINEFFNLK